MQFSSVEFETGPFVSVDHRLVRFGPGTRLPLQRVNHLGLFFLDGGCPQEIEGIGWVECGPGDFLFVASGTSREYRNPDARNEKSLHCVRLEVRLEATALPATTAVTQFLSAHFGETFLLRGAIDEPLSNLLFEMRHVMEHQPAGFVLAVEGLVLAILSRIADKRFFSTQRPQPSPGGGPALALAIGKDYIHAHFDRNLTLSEIAWKAGWSEEHFARRFKRATGLTVFDYIRRLRVERAKNLLVITNASMEQIAERCGFESGAYFSRVFKELTGRPPTVYRQEKAATVSV